MGLCYRKLGNYDKAIEVYKKSLEIDPIGMTPLQNIAMAYMYKHEYYKAIDAYKRLEAIDKSNPEVYYGLGNVYANALHEYEKGLDYICKAYNLYIKIKSPYRTDAEKVINMIYSEMKKVGKEEEFNKILEENHISPFENNTGKSTDRDKAALFNIQKTLSARACVCIDSINTRNKSRVQVSEEISACIKKQISGYVSSLTILKSFSAMYKMMEQNKDSASQQAVPVMAPTSDELRHYYYDIERFMFFDCKEIRRKIRAEEIDNRLEVGDNPQSFALYTQAQEELNSGDFQKAIEYCEKALKIDPNFAFAWNTIALSYNKLGEYDKTVSACNESMRIDLLSMTPHFMKASAYREMKQFDKAIAAYQTLTSIIPDKPEPFYELGKFYFEVLHDVEKGLENMCTAYQVFNYDSPPIKADIENNIRLMYTEMKNAGKEELFEKIRKEHKVPSSSKP
ncbi:MAG: tetratricopeptide repeat protein [Ignavibacteria bacterium]|nr:tetratricopeptide repeat protein [Ignavibacteria bacterium]